MALFEIGLTLLFLIVLIILVVVAFFFWGFKRAFALGVNSLIGFFALHAIKVFLWPDLAINFWSVILVAIFGIFGFLFVLLFHALGIWF